MLSLFCLPKKVTKKVHPHSNTARLREAAMCTGCTTVTSTFVILFLGALQYSNKSSI